MKRVIFTNENDATEHVEHTNVSKYYCAVHKEDYDIGIVRRRNYDDDQFQLIACDALTRGNSWDLEDKSFEDFLKQLKPAFWLYQFDTYQEMFLFIANHKK